MSGSSKFPRLMPAAERLLYICLGVICVYLLGVAVYAGNVPDDALHRANAYELLRSAYLASVLALGGSFLFDLELRRAQR